MKKINVVKQYRKTVTGDVMFKMYTGALEENEDEANSRHISVEERATTDKYIRIFKRDISTKVLP